MSHRQGTIAVLDPDDCGGLFRSLDVLGAADTKTAVTAITSRSQPTIRHRLLLALATVGRAIARFGAAGQLHSPDALECARWTGARC